MILIPKAYFETLLHTEIIMCAMSEFVDIDIPQEKLEILKDSADAAYQDILKAIDRKSEKVHEKISLCLDFPDVNEIDKS